MRRSRTRALTTAQAVSGLATVAAAGALARRVDGPAPWLAPVIRVLGARQLVQAALVYTVDDPLFLRAGALIDVAHAASLIPVAARSHRLRGLATTSAALAMTSALAGWDAAPRST